ncbi:7-cyano-7-deazaguanine synthase QueC [Methyloligella solikamskensis]|uniref:7-cyano-7-deazaguanine synthase n=1 Tax=Methyloligella solikamskensis TaxID=1177756 RepID=A0ABW3JAP0_9HYPH
MSASKPTKRSDNSLGALVLFSGGQDSTVCLAHALSRYAHVETVGFDYGQRHSVELECRARLLKEFADVFPDWAGKLGPDHMLDITGFGQIAETSLTGKSEIVMLDNGLPSTFVPGRNLVFFTYAAALAYRRDLPVLVGGMCETDYSGYPDCRNETLQAMERALQLGTEKDFQIDTPLMWLSKAETWALADRLGGQPLVDLIIEHSHTCYRGDHETRHDWGYGCGDCPACELRAKGYREWQASL